MRIVHVVPSYLPARRYGGTIISVHGLCRALAARGHEVTVATTNVDGPGNSDVPTGVPVDLDGVQVLYFPSRFLRRLYYAPAMREALDRLIPGADVVHGHSVFLWPTLEASRAAARHGVPYVLSPRGMLVGELIRRRSSLVKSAWIRLVERRNLKRAAAVHFTSTIEQQEAEALGLPLPPAFVVPNGVDIPRDAARRPEPATILALGRVSWKKGLDLLVESLVELPETRLMIVGNDDEGALPAILELAVAKGVRERITVEPFADETRKAVLFARATCLALASRSENFGNVVAEAMAHGCPVIVTPEVGIADFVMFTACGLVTDGSTEALVSAIRRMCEDPEEAAAMGARGREAARDHLSWETVAEAMLEQYARLQL